MEGREVDERVINLLKLIKNMCEYGLNSSGLVDTQVPLARTCESGYETLCVIKAGNCFTN
jgi:hypothetical protein